MTSMDNIKTYIDNKIYMLRNDFKMKLTKSEIAHMQTLTTENQVDNYAHSLFMEKL